MAANKGLAFIRTPSGVKCVAQRASFHLTFEEIIKLSAFAMSGEQASTARLRENLAHNREKKNLSAS